MVAIAAVVPALFLRIAGGRLNPLADTAIFGIAILAAGLLLSWGAEAAEKQVSQGLVLAGVALVTVLPEYAVDLYYAFRAGQQPASDYVHYAAANMTGANRLLVGFAWPLMVLLNAWQTREETITLREANLVEIGFLMLSSLYAFVILCEESDRRPRFRGARLDLQCVSLADQSQALPDFQITGWGGG